MRIVYVAPFALWPKGTTISRVLPMARSMARRGHEVVVFVPCNGKRGGKREVRGGRVRVGEGELVLRDFTVPHGGAASHAVASLVLARGIAELRPDLVHIFKPKGHGGIAGVLLGLARARGELRPLFVADGDDLEGFGGMNDVMDYRGHFKLFFHLQELTIPFLADGMTAASAFLVDMYRRPGAACGPVRHVPNGYNPFFHSPEGVEKELLRLLDLHLPFTLSRPAVPDEVLAGTCIEALEGLTPARTIGIFSRFRDHGADRVLAVFGRVQRERPDTCFLFVGGGGDGDGAECILERKCGESLREGSYVITGLIPPTVMDHVLSRCSIAMMPLDRTDIARAKCPAKLTDLMALGKAVVADAVGECPEYLGHGKVGLLVHGTGQKENLHEFTTKLVGLLDDPGKVAGLGRKARETIISDYSWEKLTNRVAELYDELLNARG